MSLPRIDSETLKPGDRVDIMVDGRTYPTVIDDYGVQRFVADRHHYLIKRLRKVAGEDWGNPDGDIEDLNEMVMRYHRKEFGKIDFAEMNMALGYSVCGFCDLSNFQDWDIDNPLWGVEEEPDPTTVKTYQIQLSNAARDTLKMIMQEMIDEGGQFEMSYYGTSACRAEAKAAVAKMLALEIPLVLLAVDK